eukprot:Gb_01432 [translate_table: standard]
MRSTHSFRISFDESRGCDIDYLHIALHVPFRVGAADGAYARLRLFHRSRHLSSSLPTVTIHGLNLRSRTSMFTVPCTTTLLQVDIGIHHHVLCVAFSFAVGLRASHTKVHSCDYFFTRALDMMLASRRTIFMTIGCIYFSAQQSTILDIVGMNYRLDSTLKMH